MIKAGLTFESPSSQGRQHFWDALRAFLMLLGIPYHVALSYRPGQNWIVRSDEGLGLFTWLAEVIHIFRMPAFFVIAGYFAMLLLSRRDPMEWLAGRWRRLAIPFAATLALLVPLMNLACELSNLPWRDAMTSWRHNSMTSGGYWVRHLWFIVVLLYCSTALVWLASRRAGVRTFMLSPRIDGSIAQRLPLSLAAIALGVGLWEALAVEAFWTMGLATNLPQQIMRLDELIAYAPWFALGCLLNRAPRTLEQVCRPSLPILAGAIGSTVLFLALRESVLPAAGRLLATFPAVLFTQVLIGAASQLADKPMPAIRRITDASFVIYLVHMPIVTVLVLAGQALPIPVALKATGVMAATFALSWGAWRLVERSPVLAFLFDGRPLPERRRAELQAATA